jgi:hypothetical protein
MNDDLDFERATREFLDEGSDRTRATTIDAVLLAVRTTPQERDLRIPWRTTPMSNPMRLVAAIAIVLVAGVAAFNLFGSSPGVGGVASPSPTAAQSNPAPAPTAAPSSDAIDTATWQTYTSRRYGFSIGRPADWSVHHIATRDWTYPADANANGYNAAVETFVSPNEDIAASAWSVAVKPGTAADTWIQAYCALIESDTPCSAIKANSVAVTMDGHAGSLVSFATDTQAFILVGNRMYVVAIWRPAIFIGVPGLVEAYLSTMHLLPGGPQPSAATPRPS